MFAVIALLGAGVAGVGLWGFVFPAAFLAWMKRFAEMPKGLYWLIGLRLLLGCLLLIAAPLSQYPTVFYVVGVLSLFGALVTGLLGRSGVDSYLHWWLKRPTLCLRAMLLVAWLLGVLLVYIALVSL